MSNQFNDIKSILKELELSLTTEKYSTLLDLLDKAEEDSFHNRIGLLLDNCDRIRSNIELLEGMSEFISLDLNTNGIVYSKKIKLFLLGDFSSGKTTFIKRLLSKLVGVSSQFPQTSSIIRHFGSSSKMQVIMPSKTYTPPTNLKFEFSKVVRKFGLDKYFTQHGDSWNVEDESISITDWQDTRIVDFVGAIDNYPGFIECIDWGHKLSDKTRKYSLLDYADVYDVPGIGGEVEHDRVIGAAVGGSPDIIVYLIDPSRGVPGRNEESTLINIALKNSEAHFVWCYQKSIEDKTDNFVEDQERELGAFVSKMIERAQDNSMEASDIHAVSIFFEEARVIDATGDIDDNFGAVDKVTTIISQFYLKNTRRYVDSRISKLKGIPVYPKILEINSPEGQNSPEGLLIRKLIALGSRPDVKRKDLDVLLKELFENDLLADYLKTHSDSKFASFMNDKVNAAIDLIVSKSVEVADEDSIISAFVKGWKNQSNVDAPLNLNFLGRGFERLHKSNHELQVAIPLLQAYILYILFSDNRLERIYRKDIESHIIEQVEQDLELLKKGIGV